MRALLHAVNVALGITAVIGSGIDEDDGLWWANAATGDDCIGVYGFDTEEEALKALLGAVRSRKRKARK